MSIEDLKYINQHINPKFVADLTHAFGEEMKVNVNLCLEIYSALTNVDWFHPDFKFPAGFSFRMTGGIIADIIGHGDYMDWYCSAPEGEVSEKIAEAMAKFGWSYKIIGASDD